MFYFVGGGGGVLVFLVCFRVVFLSARNQIKMFLVV